MVGRALYYSHLHSRWFYCLTFTVKHNKTTFNSILKVVFILTRKCELNTLWCSHPDLNRNSIARSRFWVCRVYQFRHGSKYKHIVAYNPHFLHYFFYYSSTSVYFEVYKSLFSSTSSLLTFFIISSILGKSLIEDKPK